MNNTNLSMSEFDEFIGETSGIAGYSKILSDGFQYADDIAFWSWMKNSYKNIPGGDLQNWLLSHPGQMEKTLRSKGFEWDIYRQYHPQIIDRNIIHSIKFNDSERDVINTSMSGKITGIQVKTFNHPDTIRNAHSKLSKYDGSTKIAINRKAYDSAVIKGIPKDQFIKPVSDKKIQASTERRIDQVKNTKLQYSISLNGILKQAGKGALIGAVIGIGSSTVINYKKYKNGIISFEEYRGIILKEGAKSALMGSSIAVINVGVQYSAAMLGFGFPVTIPVMIIVGIGLNSIIDPIFKDGKYKEILEKIEITTDVQKGYYDFGVMSIKLFSYQNDLILNSIDSLKRIDALDKEYKPIDDEFDKMIKNLK